MRLFVQFPLAMLLVYLGHPYWAVILMLVQFTYNKREV
jgi:hypothetical protein